MNRAYLNPLDSLEKKAVKLLFQSISLYAPKVFIESWEDLSEKQFLKKLCSLMENLSHLISLYYSFYPELPERYLDRHELTYFELKRQLRDLNLKENQG
jgi:hypothetical protein